MSPAEQRLATSVPAIGSGGSGPRATIQLAERGTDVLVVGKRASADTLKECYFLADLG